MVQAGRAKHKKMYMHIQCNTIQCNKDNGLTSTQNSLGDIRNKHAKVKCKFQYRHNRVSNPDKNKKRGNRAPLKAALK